MHQKKKPHTDESDVSKDIVSIGSKMCEKYSHPLIHPSLSPIQNHYHQSHHPLARIEKSDLIKKTITIK